MCIMSAVHQGAAQVQADFWNKEAYDAFIKMQEAARVFDESTKQPECIDPAKEKLVREILDVLKQKGII